MSVLYRSSHLSHKQFHETTALKTSVCTVSSVDTQLALYQMSVKPERYGNAVWLIGYTIRIIEREDKLSVCGLAFQIRCTFRPEFWLRGTFYLGSAQSQSAEIFCTSKLLGLYRHLTVKGIISLYRLLCPRPAPSVDEVVISRSKLINSLADGFCIRDIIFCRLGIGNTFSILPSNSSNCAFNS